MLKSKKRYVFLVFLFFLTIICLGLFLVSYTAALALILGTVLGLLAKRNFWLLVKYTNFFKNTFKKRLKIVFLLLTIFSGYFISKILTPSIYEGPSIPVPFTIKTDQVRIYLSNNFEFLTIDEIIKLDDKNMSDVSTLLDDIEKELRNRKILKILDQNHIKLLILRKKSKSLDNSEIGINVVGIKANAKNIGLISKEIEVKPLFKRLYLTDLNCINLEELRYLLCFKDNFKIKIKLVDFSSGTFSKAYNSAGTSITSQGEDRETINWDLQDIEEGIKFAYFPYPYNVFNRYLKPFLFFTSVNKWLIVTIGGIVSFILKPLPKQIINTSGGNYNEHVQGDYIQGNYTNLSQEFSEASVQIHQLLMQLQNQGYSQEQAQQQIAQDLAKKAENNPTVLDKLVKWRQSLGNTAANTTVNKAAKEVFKIALKLLNIPIP